MATTAYSGPMLEGLNRSNAANRELDIRDREAQQRYLLGLLNERNRSQLGNRGIDLNAMLGRQQYDVGMAGVGANRYATDVRSQLGQAEINRLIAAANQGDALAKAQLEQRRAIEEAKLAFDRDALDAETSIKGRELNILAQQGGFGGLPAAVQTQIMRLIDQQNQDADLGDVVAQRAAQAVNDAINSDASMDPFESPDDVRKKAAKGGTKRQAYMDVIKKAYLSLPNEDAVLIQVNPDWDPSDPRQPPFLPRSRRSSGLTPVAPSTGVPTQSRLPGLLGGRPFDPTRLQFQ